MMMSMLRMVLAECISVFVVAAAMSTPAVVAAQSKWPERPIKLIPNGAAGGTADLLARVLSQGLAQDLKVPVVVEPKAGAGGMIGASQVAKSAPDGYTLLVTAPGALVGAPYIYKQVPYQPEDLVGVTIIGEVANLLTVSNKVPVKDVRELVEYAKVQAGKVNYATAGMGTTSHLGAAWFMRLTGTSGEVIHYQGAAPAMLSVMSSVTDVAIDSLPTYLPQVRAGSIKALAVSSAKRSPFAPDIPTVIEAGVPEFAVTAWFALVAPAGVSPQVLESINAAVLRMLRTDQAKEQLQKLGTSIVGSSVDETRQFVVSQRIVWKQLVEAAGLKPN